MATSTVALRPVSGEGSGSREQTKRGTKTTQPSSRPGAVDEVCNNCVIPKNDARKEAFIWNLFGCGTVSSV